jgi:hypothetical protein
MCVAGVWPIMVLLSVQVLRNKEQEIMLTMLDYWLIKIGIWRKISVVL